MKDARSIAKEFLGDTPEAIALERKIITFARQFKPSKYDYGSQTLYPENLAPDTQLLLNISNEYSEIVTIKEIKTPSEYGYVKDEIIFTVNGIENKKDILFFEPILLTYDLVIALDFEIKERMGWFTQKKTGFPLVYEKTVQEIEKYDREKKEVYFEVTDHYDFFKIINEGRKRYKLKINFLHELQILHYKDTGHVILLAPQKITYEKDFNNCLGLKSATKIIFKP